MGDFSEESSLVDASVLEVLIRLKCKKSGIFETAKHC